MKGRVLFVHRLISLLAAVFWLMQAASGIAISFRSEIDDTFLGHPAVPLDPARFGARIDQLQAGGASISSVWASGGRKGQFDAYLTLDEVDRTVRIDGMGRLHRDRPDSQFTGDGALFETLTQFHQTLLLDDIGTIIIGISGLLLITNVVLGLVLAWRRRGMLKLMLRRPTGTRAARLLGWHRRLGLWFAGPALIFAAAGVALAFESEVESFVGGETPRPVGLAVDSQVRVGTGAAVSTVLRRFPGSELTALVLPAEDTSWYRVRVLAPGELPRKYGSTTVYVSASDGRILLAHDARRSAPGRKLVEALYPLHTGQIGGLAGRILNLAFGFALLVMLVLGVLLWTERRQLRKLRDARY